MNPAISVKGLTKQFGPRTVVDKVTFSANIGEVLGFLGPNGAGKSTTMKMIFGFLSPSEGSAEVCGFDVLKDPLNVKRSVGYLPEGAPAYPDMTPLGFLRFISGIRGYNGSEREERVQNAVHMTRIEEVAQQPIETLSKGYKRRVGLAQALLHDPKVLILDEPTSALGQKQQMEVLKTIKKVQQLGNIAIILITHNEIHARLIADRYTFISLGEVIGSGTSKDLEGNDIRRLMAGGAEVGDLAKELA